MYLLTLDTKHEYEMKSNNLTQHIIQKSYVYISCPDTVYVTEIDKYSCFCYLTLNYASFLLQG